MATGLVLVLLAACGDPHGAGENAASAAGEEHAHGDAHEEAHDHGDEHGGDDHGDDHHGDDDHGDEAWSLTAWGEHYEIFPEIAPPVAGESVRAHTHVTVLSDFSPLARGRVEIVLSADGAEEVFAAETAVRPGVFDVEIRASEAGEFDLAFRVDGPAGRETIGGGRLRVGTADEPGRPLRLPAPQGASSGAEPVELSKEEQWQAPFATTWVRRGSLPRSVEGLARVRPAAGGEAWITAPVAGLLRPAPWPYTGEAVAADQAMFRLAPSVRAERSLAELEADVEAAEEEMQAAQRRLARLQTLLEVEATSEGEIDEARTALAVRRARVGAAQDDLRSARAARSGRGGGETLALRAPFAGRVAGVEATPGTSVEAGDRLARVVRSDVAWLAVDLSPQAGDEVERGLQGVLLGGGDAGRSFAADEIRLVSVAPEVDAESGKLRVLIEIPGGAAVPLGSSWTAQVQLASDGREGTVIPTTALVDDGGVTVVYLQLSGERFVRQPVDVVDRQGARTLVSGLVPGQRLVARGGDVIRRASLLESGAGGHGHMH